jgi:DnaJ-domain-containing protein 1
MPTLIFGALILVAAIWVMGVISRIDPKIGARVLKAGGGLLALGLAVFLGLRGEIWVAVPLGGFGLGLLGWLPFGPAGFSARTTKSSGKTSQVRSATFEMELDHDTGEMRGRIVAGRHQGAELARLDVKTLVEMLTEIDDESRALLMAYLDRRDPRWREHAQGDTATGRTAASSGKMSEQEAYQILGVQSGASANEIGRAHRALMKKFHPDQGGSTYLAARINEAKEVLTRSHR